MSLIHSSTLLNACNARARTSVCTCEDTLKGFLIYKTFFPFHAHSGILRFCFSPDREEMHPLKISSRVHLQRDPVSADSANPAKVNVFLLENTTSTGHRYSIHLAQTNISPILIKSLLKYANFLPKYFPANGSRTRLNRRVS